MTDLAPSQTSNTETNNLTGPLMVLAGGICIGFAPIALRLGLSE